jgi:hypothetical protein
LAFGYWLLAIGSSVETTFLRFFKRLMKKLNY